VELACVSLPELTKLCGFAQTRLMFPAQTTAMALNSMLVLVASDDAALVSSITDSLHDSGYHVSTNWSSQDEPGVIVLDTALPEDARADLLRSMSSPIVALSSPAALKQAASIDGVWVCLTKPLDTDNLVLAVDRISRYTGA
jgi:DNA-binding response OmpR family regulator